MNVSSSYRAMPFVPLRATDKLIALLIFFYWVVYENVLFFYPMEYGGAVFFVVVNAIKLLLPLFLIFLTGLPSLRMLKRGPIRLYLSFFVAFLLWGLVPTVISGDVLSWFKLLPRLVFFLGVFTFFSKRVGAFLSFAKCIVIYVLCTLLQYILLYLTGANDNYRNAVFTAGGNNLMAGPFGVLGNVISTVTSPVLPFPIFRLCGYWNEPSNAAGTAIAAFFLGRYLVSVGERPIWRRASNVCLVAGFLALSNAGYFALGSALLVGLLWGTGRFTVRRAVQSVLVLSMITVLLWVAFLGRLYVAENLQTNVWATVISGLRQQSDPFAGRLGLVQMTLDKTAESLIGIGIQEAGSGGIDASGTAPLYWLLLTGVPGLLLILSREAVLFGSSLSLLRRVPAMLPLIQALVAVMAQQLSYGSWMNPNYLILAAMVLVCSQRVAPQAQATNGLRHA